MPPGKVTRSSAPLDAPAPVTGRLEVKVSPLALRAEVGHQHVLGLQRDGRHCARCGQGCAHYNCPGFVSMYAGCARETGGGGWVVGGRTTASVSKPTHRRTKPARLSRQAVPPSELASEAVGATSKENVIPGSDCGPVAHLGAKELWRVYGNAPAWAQALIRERGESKVPLKQPTL